MKIHAFKVEKSDCSIPFKEVLQKVESEKSLKERIRLINQTELRAESIEQRNGLWLIDFIRIRTDHGPGKVGRDSEVEGFKFGDEEGFGEETAALFDPDKEYILVQYNHSGVRAGSMADYFSAYDTDNLYSFKPKYDEDVERRLINQGITRKIAFSLDITKMSEQDRLRGKSLSEAIEYGRINGADKIKVEISVQGDRGRGLIEKSLETIISLQKIVWQNPDAVTKLEVSGKENQDSITEVLDLIAHRLSVEINDIEVGPDLRYSKRDRWDALERARNGWSQVLK